MTRITKPLLTVKPGYARRPDRGRGQIQSGDRHHDREDRRASALAREAFADLGRTRWTLEEIAAAFEAPAFVMDAEFERDREAAE